MGVLEEKIYCISGARYMLASPDSESNSVVCFARPAEPERQSAC